MPVRSRPALTAVALLAALAAAGCAAGPSATDPGATAPSTPAPTDASDPTTAAPPTTSAAPTPSAAPTSQPGAQPSADDAADLPAVDTADWQVVETEDGLFRWRMPADWRLDDASGEEDTGHVNMIGILDEGGHRLAELHSSAHGDGGGGACSDWDGDGSSTVPAMLHQQQQNAIGTVSVVTTQPAADRFWFFAGYSPDALEPERAPCVLTSAVTVPASYPVTSFATTGDPALWQVDSFEQGAAYAAGEQLAELVTMFLTLELTGA